MSDRATLVVRHWGARYRGRSFPVSVGRGGIGSKRGEGDGISPVGRYRLGQVWYRADRLAGIDGTPLTYDNIWSDDPSDPDYNQPLRGRNHPFSHERLWRGNRLYDLIGVLDYNMDPVVPGRGSAIFLHCWRGPRIPTAGCIAFREPDLRWILSRWRPRDDVSISR